MQHSEAVKAIETGLASLDAEHMGQLERMERLEAAIDAGEPVERVKPLLTDLIDYLDAHFMSEQIAMREHAYPAYEPHVSEHEDAIALLRGLESRCSEGDGKVAVEILAALRGWLIRHVQTTDRSLASFMKARGVEIHPEG